MFREKRTYGQDPDVVVRSKPPTFNLPFKLRPGSKVFTCSWSDFFIREADSWRDEAWRIIEQTPHLTYLILTKRIERALTRLPWGDGEPWPHVWLLVSVEDQETADQRIPRLLETNVAMRGVSAEPLLGPIGFSSWKRGSYLHTVGKDGAAERPGLDWVICGGESGPQARPMHRDWARAIRDQCQASGVPYFFKQWGEFVPVIGNHGGPPHYKDFQHDILVHDGTKKNALPMRRVGKKQAGRLLDGRTWDEFPP